MRSNHFGDVAAGTTATAGESADAKGTFSLSLQNVSLGFDATAKAGVTAGGTASISGSDGKIDAEAKVCAGCVGVGVTPSIGVSGCTVTVGASGTLDLGVGVSFDASASLNFCSVGDAIKKAAEEVGHKLEAAGEDVVKG